jgi:hypothetical protein
MEFALSEKNERIVAEPNIKGFCPICKTPMTPKCGKVYAYHWAHKSKADCDPWWENETKWHRQWKENVYCDFREIVIQKDGIKHIADVQLPSGIIFEFQKSPLSIDERQARENFYNKMIWIIHFDKDKILETTIREIYEPTFDDSLVTVKSFSEGFFSCPHLSPIFLDFDNGDMFWIKEFDFNNTGRVKRFYGRFIKKSEFISDYLIDPKFSDVEDLKITHYHYDYNLKLNQLFAVRKELDEIKEQLRVAKEQLLLEKQQKWYQVGTSAWCTIEDKLEKYRKPWLRYEHHHLSRF